jgi:hypothetical protein
MIFNKRKKLFVTQSEESCGQKVVRIGKMYRLAPKIKSIGKSGGTITRRQATDLVKQAIDRLKSDDKLDNPTSRGRIGPLRTELFAANASMVHAPPATGERVKMT